MSGNFQSDAGRRTDFLCLKGSIRSDLFGSSTALESEWTNQRPRAILVGSSDIIGPWRVWPHKSSQVVTARSGSTT